jgi:hypothetical protein
MISILRSWRDPSALQDRSSYLRRRSVARFLAHEHFSRSVRVGPGLTPRTRARLGRNRTERQVNSSVR